MQLPLASPVVLVALLASTSTGVAPTARNAVDDDRAIEVENVAAEDVLPSAAPCPAYIGPQCSSRAHEQWVTGQDIVDLAGLIRAA